MTTKINIIGKYIELDGTRYLSQDNIVLISMITTPNGTKIAFNFENIVNAKNEDIFVPEFHYIFADKENADDIFSFLKFRLENKGYILVKTNAGPKLVNKEKINSFYIDSDNNLIYINLNSSIHNNVQGKGVSSLSVCCQYDSLAELKEARDNLI